MAHDHEIAIDSLFLVHGSDVKSGALHQTCDVSPAAISKLMKIIIFFMAEAMVTPRRKYRRPAMVTPKSYPYP